MAVINPPAWLQAGTYNARADRLAVGSLLEAPGVTDAASLVVTQTVTPSMAVLVSAGTAYVLNSYSTFQGYYTVVNDAAITVNLDASHPNFGRIDAIVVTVRDAQYAGVDNYAEITKITGTPSTAPTVGSIPENSIILALVTVPALSSSVPNANISTTVRQYARFKSSLVDVNRVVTSTTRPPAPYIGQTIFETDTQAIKMWMGTGTGGWKVTSPTTAQNTTSTSRPGGTKVWPGLIIFETDTERLYAWTGTKWAYHGGGNGEPLPALGAWNPTYTPTPKPGHEPIKMWRDATGRIRIAGTWSNAVPITAWNINAVYGVAVVPAPYVPANDIAVISQICMPSVGNHPFNLIIRGTTGSGWGGSPGTILWQPSSSLAVTFPVRSLAFCLPETSWEQQ